MVDAIISVAVFVVVFVVVVESLVVIVGDWDKGFDLGFEFDCDQKGFFFFFYNDGFGDLMRKLVEVFVVRENKRNKKLKVVCLQRK